MTIKAAVIQARPVYYDLAGSVDKALALFSEAGAQGAQVVALGETWLPGYPAWLDVCVDMGLWDHTPTKRVFQQLYENSITIPGAETALFCEAARRFGMVLVLSVNERAGGTLYNSMITIDETGTIRNHHRKLMPTYTERLVWGMGDGAGLQAVDTAAGRVGGLICWEHWMPLARQAMHDSGEQIHVSVFPTVNEPRNQLPSRHYAFEGRCFVLTVGSILRADDLPPDLKLKDGIRPDDLVQSGGSAIIAPDARYLAGPCFDEETILYADLDLGETIREKMTLDVSGHYSRPDVFSFGVNRERKG
jgi:predicted amidohydrolase